MNLTAEQFFNVFTQYNTAVWPAQIGLYLLGIAAIVLAFKPSHMTARLITLILSFLWAWMGIVYHLLYFTQVNPAAYLFGAAYIAQAVLLVAAGVLGNRLSFQPRWNLASLLGGFFMLYGLLIYSVLGYFLGHVYPDAPNFGLPCPTTIFTFGLLLWTDKKVPWYVLVIPFLWSLLGFSAALRWGVLEDVMLLITGLVATALIIYRDRTSRDVTPAYPA